MMTRLFTAVLLLCPVVAIAYEPTLKPLYDGKFAAGATAWVGEQTSSKRVQDGLRILDPSDKAGSARSYGLNWQADPKRGAWVEVRMKTVSCSDPWGVSVLTADGVHEEAVTFFPDRIELARSEVKVPFRTDDALHTYRIHIQGTDYKLWADGTLLIDARGKFTYPAVGGRNRIAFGAQASSAMGESIWQYVKYDSGRQTNVTEMQTQITKVEGLQITRGETKVIATGRYVSMFKFGEGDVVVDGMRSRDGGKTWSKSPGVSGQACRLKSGRILWLDFHTEPAQEKGWFTTKRYWSDDNGKTIQQDVARIYCPREVGGSGDNGKWYKGLFIDHAIIRLPDDSLLAACYGRFEEDTELQEGYPAEWNFRKYRSYVIRSTDDGETWEYYSTIASGPIGQEGCCEPDLLQLPSGDIIALMRTGGGRGRYTPLHECRSTDHGKTWSKPRPVADRGVFPNMCRMDNGVIVATYGRPGNWLMFSLDDGRTWVGHFCFAEQSGSCYNWVEEVRPDTILVTYDQSGVDADGNAFQKTLGTFFTVKRD